MTRNSGYRPDDSAWIADGGQWKRGIEYPIPDLGVFYIRKVEENRWEVMERLDTQTADHIDDDCHAFKTYSGGVSGHVPESSVIRSRSGIIEFVPVCWAFDEAGAARVADALSAAYRRARYFGKPSTSAQAASEEVQKNVDPERSPDEETI